MAVAFGSSVSVTPATGTNTGASPSITTPTTNPVVVVHVGLADATATVTSLTITGFGGTPSEVKNARDAGNAFVSIWVIVAPTANTAGTVQANLSASVPYQMVVETFSAADQTAPSPTGDAVSSTTSTTPETLTPTNLTANDASAGAEGNAAGQNLNAATPNSRYLDNTTAINLGVGDATGTTGITFSTNSGPFTYPKVAIRIAWDRVVTGGSGLMDTYPRGDWFHARRSAYLSYTSTCLYHSPAWAEGFLAPGWYDSQRDNYSRTQ